MRLRGLPLESVTVEHLHSLVLNGVAESRVLDYKVLLPGTNDDEKRKFLASVNALANTEGGTIAYGISARDASGKETGIAQEVLGLEQFDFDRLKLTLTQSVQSNFDPAFGSRLEFVEITSAGRLGSVLLLGVPRSFNGPHRITFKGLNKFYHRTSAGIAEPDVQELRAMFNEQGSWSQQADSFRMERLARLDLPTVRNSVVTNSPLVIHVLPLGRLSSLVDLNSRLADLQSLFLPLDCTRATAAFSRFITLQPRVKASCGRETAFRLP